MTNPHTPRPEVNRLIYLVRHGKIEQEGNERRYIGQIDLPLSSQGRKQVEEMRSRFTRADLGAVYCSDLSRSRETAEIITRGAGLEIIARKDLREINMGEWEGRTFQEMAQRFPDAFRARGEDIGHYRVPGGESFADCGQRVVAAFGEILGSSTGNLLMVGHAGVNRLLLCHVLGMPVSNLFKLCQDYACLNVIHCGKSGFQVRLLNGRVRPGRR